MKKISLNAINTNDCPCKGCGDRYVSCHSNCSKYIDWQQDHKVKLNQYKQERSIDNLLFNNQTERNKKIQQQGGIKYGRYSNDSR